MNKLAGIVRNPPEISAQNKMTFAGYYTSARQSIEYEISVRNEIIKRERAVYFAFKGYVETLEAGSSHSDAEGELTSALEAGSSHSDAEGELTSALEAGSSLSDAEGALTSALEAFKDAVDQYNNSKEYWKRFPYIVEASKLKSTKKSISALEADLVVFNHVIIKHNAEIEEIKALKSVLKSRPTKPRLLSTIEIAAVTNFLNTYRQHRHQKSTLLEEQLDSAVPLFLRRFSRLRQIIVDQNPSYNPDELPFHGSELNAYSKLFTLSTQESNALAVKTAFRDIEPAHLTIVLTSLEDRALEIIEDKIGDIENELKSIAQEDPIKHEHQNPIFEKLTQLDKILINYRASSGTIGMNKDADKCTDSIMESFSILESLCASQVDIPRDNWESISRVIHGDLTSIKEDVERNKAFLEKFKQDGLKALPMDATPVDPGLQAATALPPTRRASGIEEMLGATTSTSVEQHRMLNSAKKQVDQSKPPDSRPGT